MDERDSTVGQAEAHREAMEAKARERPDDPVTASAPEAGKWEFDGTVAEVFDDMLRRSIPNYEDMRTITTRAAAWLMDRAAMGGQKPCAFDLGASRGAALAPLVEQFERRGQYVAAEVSEPMLQTLYERFVKEIEGGILTVLPWDLRHGFPRVVSRPNVVLCVLTLQFVPVEYRQRLLREIAADLMPGGGLVLVEKVLGEADETNRIMADLYHGTKREAGYTQEGIDRKRMALEGVLVPLTADFNVSLMRSAGFDLVETIWAWANFRGWLAVRR